MRHQDLFLLNSVFSSDLESDVVEDIYVGYDKKLNLIVLLEHSDYYRPERNSSAFAVIRKANAYRLAKRLGVAMTEIPEIVAGSVGEEFDGLVNPTLGQTRECFKDILDRFLDEKTNFRLIRTYDKRGHTCY